MRWLDPTDVIIDRNWPKAWPEIDNKFADTDINIKVDLLEN